MSIIKPDWITEFFEDEEHEDFYIDDTIKIDGQSTLPKLLANFLTRKIAGQIREPGEDWSPTADNINSLPKGMKDYIYSLETLCDHQYIIRENMIMRDTIRQLEAKILEAEK